MRTETQKTPPSCPGLRTPSTWPESHCLLGTQLIYRDREALWRLRARTGLASSSLHSRGLSYGLTNRRGSINIWPMEQWGTSEVLWELCISYQNKVHPFLLADTPFPCFQLGRNHRASANQATPWSVSRLVNLCKPWLESRSQGSRLFAKYDLCRENLDTLVLPPLTARSLRPRGGRTANNRLSNCGTLFFELDWRRRAGSPVSYSWRGDLRVTSGPGQGFTS